MSILSEETLLESGKLFKKNCGKAILYIVVLHVLVADKG